jgi:hypothetical protein
VGLYSQLSITTRQSLSYIAFSAALFLHSQQIFIAVRSTIILFVSVYLKSALSKLQLGLFNRTAKQVFTIQKKFYDVVFAAHIMCTQETNVTLDGGTEQSMSY